MKTSFKPINDAEWYYVMYTISDAILEFWTDNEEDYNKKIQFIKLHHDYNLKAVRKPLTSTL